MKKRCFAAILCSALLLFAGCGAEKKDTELATALDPQNPVVLQVWNYYNGSQQMAFEAMVAAFNETVGSEKGILVEAFSQGSINGLVEELFNALGGKVAAQEVPDIVAVYPETAYVLETQDMLVNLDSYFTEEELSAYIPGFIEEGRMKESGALVSFPVLKSTELFVYNKTDWTAFEEATGIAAESLTTIEDLVHAAELYYLWTDAKTPDIPEDGKALFGRDALDNYISIGAMQLGHEIFTPTADGVQVDLDKETFRMLWDNYYIPFINGYFGAYGNYRSDDAKTGSILALVGSSSSISYFPTEVTREDDTVYSVEAAVMAPPVFAGAQTPYVVQQGAGYSVLKSDEASAEASVLFLKWIAEEEQNINFAVSTGYLPVKMAANDAEKIEAAYQKLKGGIQSDNLKQGLLTSANLLQKKETYTSKPFDGAAECRSALKFALGDISEADRETVLSRMAQGESRAEATAEFVTDAYFEAWFTGLQKKIETILDAKS